MTFHIWAIVDSIDGVTALSFEMQKRSSGGVETLLFTTSNSEDINGLDSNTPQRLTISLALSNTTILTTDRLVFRLYGTKTSLSDRSLTVFFEGNNFYSYIATTFTGVEAYVTGPTTTVSDTAVAVYNGTTGKIVKQSPV